MLNGFAEDIHKRMWKKGGARIIVGVGILCSGGVMRYSWGSPDICDTWDDCDVTTAPKQAGEKCQGAAICLLYRGAPVYEACFGYEEGRKAPITPDTVFCLASVSKSLVSVAVLLMVKRGRLSLEKREILSPFRFPISFHDILSHTTGYAFRGDAQIEARWTKEKLDRLVAKQRPSCQPGDCYFYSNYLYGYIGEYLEKQGYRLEEVASTLKRALRTKGPHFIEEARTLSNVAIPHKTDRKDKHKLTKLNLDSPYFKTAKAAAGLLASLEDMKPFQGWPLGTALTFYRLETEGHFLHPSLKTKILSVGGILICPPPSNK